MTPTFHDAVIVSVTRDEDALVLEIESVSVTTNRGNHLENGSLRIEQVTRFEENGATVELPTFSFDDGQILQLSQHPGGVTLLVEWESYRPKRTHVAEYAIDGAAVIWTKR